MTATFTLEVLQAAIGGTISVAGYPHPLRIDEVIPAPDRNRPPHLPAGFTVQLSGPAAPILPEGTYEMHLDQGVYVLHIQPLSATGAARQAYQIIIC